MSEQNQDPIKEAEEKLGFTPPRCVKLKNVCRKEDIIARRVVMNLLYYFPIQIEKQ